MMDHAPNLDYGVAGGDRVREWTCSRPRRPAVR
jgi:hypothetical protein